MTNPLSEQNVPESLKNIETCTKPSKTVKQDVKIETARNVVLK